MRRVVVIVLYFTQNFFFLRQKRLTGKAVGAPFIDLRKCQWKKHLGSEAKLVYLAMLGNFALVQFSQKYVLQVSNVGSFLQHFVIQSLRSR